MNSLVREMLVKNYEQLRSQALGESLTYALGLGLALFINKGMTAWLEAWANQQPQMEPQKFMKLPVANFETDQLLNNVTTILTNMVISVGIQEKDYDYAINSKSN